MTNNAKKNIFFVDDEPDIRTVVGRTLEQLGTKVTCFAFGADCLEQLHSQSCDLLITDVKMYDMDGIKLLTEAKHIIPSLPVIVLTGYGDIPMAVKALKAGASDFIEKPLDKYSFLLAVETVLKQNWREHPIIDKVLTKAEIKVLRLILDGKSTKEVAKLLNRSIRTIEDHRTHIMHKFGVDNLVDLVKQTAMVRMPDLGG